MKPLAAAVGTPPDPEGDKVGLSPASKMTMDEHIQRAVSLGIEKYTDEITKAKQRELEKYETICEVKRKVSPSNIYAIPLVGLLIIHF